MKDFIKVSISLVFKLMKCNYALLISKVFLEYVNNSKYKPFNVRTREGHWRQLTMRSNENKELLVIVVFDKHELDDVILLLMS